MGFSRQEYWNGLPYPPPGDLPDPGFKPASSALAGRFFITEPSGKPSTVAAHKHVWHCITKLPISSLWAQYEAFPNYIRAAFGNPREGKGLPRWCSGKESSCQCRRWDSGSISGSRRSSGEGNGTSLQYSCLENSRTEEPGGLQSIDNKEPDTTEQLTLTHTQNYQIFL